MNMTIHRGDDKVWTLTVKDKSTGLVVDISTVIDIVLTVRPSLGGATFILKNLAGGVALTDPTNGVAEITIDAADTSSLSVSSHEYIFDVEVTNNDSTIETIAEGKFLVLPDVTHT